VTTILLVRHGETDWNAERRWQGHADRPLNDVGRRQTRALAARLDDDVDAVYSSDLARARETAEILGERLGLPVRLDARLREVDVGEWSGLTTAEVEERYPEGLDRRRAGGTGWERGETHEQMGERVLEALHEIAAAHPEGSVLVVTHGGAMRAVWLACGGTVEDRPLVGNCAVHRVGVGDGSVSRID
jgi:broad specificity phosphatase PhoE